MIIFDDIISKSTQDLVEQHLTSSEFPWFFNEYTVKNKTVDDYQTLKNDDLKVKEYLQFTHGFFRQEPLYISPEYYKIKSLFDEFITASSINVNDILRVKANFQTQFQESASEFYNTPHRDQQMNHTVVIYYVNDSDGDTYVFENDKIIKTVSPKKGRFFLFDGKYFHAGRHPQSCNKRIVINYNFM